jgi:hypothetical protein
MSINKSLTILSWNADGMGDEGFHNFLEDVASLQRHWDAILVQEGPREIETVISD